MMIMIIVMIVIIINIMMMIMIRMMMRMMIMMRTMILKGGDDDKGALFSGIEANNFQFWQIIVSMQVCQAVDQHRGWLQWSIYQNRGRSQSVDLLA